MGNFRCPAKHASSAPLRPSEDDTQRYTTDTQPTPSTPHLPSNLDPVADPSWQSTSEASFATNVALQVITDAAAALP